MGANSRSPSSPPTAASGWNSEAVATGLERASLLSTKVLRERKGALDIPEPLPPVVSRVPTEGSPAGSGKWGASGVCWESGEEALRHSRAC